MTTNYVMLIKIHQDGKRDIYFVDDCEFKKYFTFVNKRSVIIDEKELGKDFRGMDGEDSFNWNMFGEARSPFVYGEWKVQPTIIGAYIWTVK